MRLTMDMRLTRRAWALLAAGALAACEPSLAPPFEIDTPGAVEGLAYFDADENRAFDPSAGDYALSGITVQVRERGTERVLANGTASTDAEGRFVLQGLPAGTHDAYVVPESLPDGIQVCANPTTVTINPDQTAFFRLEARQACLVLIQEAKEQPLGSRVVVRGVVTSTPGQIRSSYVYIQDASSGIRLFTSALNNAGLELGDRIEVSGDLAAFNADLQLSNVSLRAVDKGFGVIAPAQSTTAEITAATDPKSPLRGRLVTVRGAKITEGFGTLSNNQNATILDASGTAAQLRIEPGVAAAAQLPTLFPAGRCYDITGVVGGFNATGQLFPRSTSDVVEVPCT
jgi:hypothetical protein